MTNQMGSDILIMNSNDGKGKDTIMMDVSKKTNQELIASLLKADAEARLRAISEKTNYSLKGASKGHVYVMTPGRNRNFVGPNGCSCEHFQFVISQLNEEAEKRAVKVEPAACKHTYVVQLLQAK